MVNVEDYSDQQLKESLLEFGVNVPVTPTTRKVCENKLKKMMADGDSPSKQTSIPRTPSQQDIDFADNREETPENPSPHVYRRSVPSAQHQSSRHNASELADQSDNEGEVSVRNLSKQERELYRTRSQQNDGSSVWKYIGIVFLLGVFISFLVFLNRNAQQIGDEI